MSHTQQFIDLYGVLSDRAGWFGPEPSTRAVQALTLVLADRLDLIDALPQAQQDLRGHLKWFSNLRGTLGQSLIALALVKGVVPKALPARVNQIYPQFKQHRIPTIGLWPTAAAAWLALEPAAASEGAIPRMSAILTEWKKDHPWITGHDDLHAAALHALGDHSPVDVRTLVEDRMVALEDVVFSWAPNNRQRVAQLAALRPTVEAADLAQRYNALSEHLQSLGSRVSLLEREAMVLLASANGDPATLARAYQSTRAQLSAMGGSTWLPKNIQGVVAVGLVAADNGQDSLDAIAGSTLAAIIIALQTAVIVASSSAAAAS